MQMTCIQPLEIKIKCLYNTNSTKNRYTEISMHFFKYRGNELFAEHVPVKRLAEQYGTPLYIYSYNTLLQTF